MGLTLLAPSLMLNLINTAYYGFGQFLPGLLSIFFFRSIRPAGIVAGLIAGDLFAIGMHLAQLNFLNINIGLIALLINFTVAYAISMYLKRKQKAQTAFEEPIAYNSIELEETYPKNSVIVD
jgi:SSS family solute:Na+ symporter